MLSDRVLDIVGIIGVVAVLLISFLIQKNKDPRDYYEVEAKRFNNSPVMYSFFIFSVSFLLVSIFADFIESAIEGYQFSLLFKYGFPVFAAFISYCGFTRRQKLKNKKKKKGLIVQ